MPEEIIFLFICSPGTTGGRSPNDDYNFWGTPTMLHPQEDFVNIIIMIVYITCKINNYRRMAP